MAPGAITEDSSASAVHSFDPIIEKLRADAMVAPTKFDPKKHLAYTPPENVLMMKDIGYAEDVGISPVAVSQPFQLFTQEAVEQMRAEILNPTVIKEHGIKSNIADGHLRGYAPFAYEAWHHPEVLGIISKIAGIDLVPVFDYELGHINFSVKSDKQTQQELAAIESQKRAYQEDEGIAGCPYEDDKPVVGWHKDSYPFVCVLMLSDCTDMVGGETVLFTGDEKNVLKVRGPQMGCAVVMQGRYIAHQALRAHGSKERITSVTSFKAKDPLVKDDSNLNTTRGISDVAELYYEFGEYRLEMLEERVRAKLKAIRKHHQAGKKFDERSFKAFLKQQTAFLEATDTEILEYEHVVAGHQPELHLPNAVAKMLPNRSRTFE